MQTWYTIPLGDGIIAPALTAEIEAAFLPLFAASGQPADMAVFTRSESEGRLHCEVIAYFSPAAVDVANTFDAKPCAPPARAELGLLAGDPRAWSALFPEST